MSIEIICDDSLHWLKLQKNESIGNFVTGICDMDEINMSMPNYLKFIDKIVRLIFDKLAPDGYAIFIQTDRKYNRSWVDKSHIISKIADEYNLKMIWHKIVLHRSVDSTDTYRPTYAHMLCYSKNGTTGSATPDVLPISKKLYKNGTPLLAGLRAIEFISLYSKHNLIVDPFVGRGVITAISNLLKIPSIGIDIDKDQCKIAEKFEFDKDDLKFLKSHMKGTSVSKRRNSLSPKRSNRRS